MNRVVIFILFLMASSCTTDPILTREDGVLETRNAHCDGCDDFTAHVEFISYDAKTDCCTYELVVTPIPGCDSGSRIAIYINGVLAGYQNAGETRFRYTACGSVPSNWEIYGRDKWGNFIVCKVGQSTCHIDTDGN